MNEYFRIFPTLCLELNLMLLCATILYLGKVSDDNMESLIDEVSLVITTGKYLLLDQSIFVVQLLK